MHQITYPCRMMSCWFHPSSATSWPVISGRALRIWCYSLNTCSFPRFEPQFSIWGLWRLLSCPDLVVQGGFPSILHAGFPPIHPVLQHVFIEHLLCARQERFVGRWPLWDPACLTPLLSFGPRARGNTYLLCAKGWVLWSNSLHGLWDTSGSQGFPGAAFWAGCLRITGEAFLKRHS